MPTVSQQLSAFIADTTYDQLPAEVVSATKRFVYDSVGCAFGGVRTHDWGMADRVDQAMGGKEQCTILGTGRKANVLSASFLNALAVRALDYNDIYWKQDPSHPSDIIPGVWACAEYAAASAEDVIVAIAIADEGGLTLTAIGATTPLKHLSGSAYELDTPDFGIINIGFIAEDDGSISALTINGYDFSFVAIKKNQ